MNVCDERPWQAAEADAEQCRACQTKQWVRAGRQGETR